jgi:eukaryotic-like serine/threonine-protein kinase
MSAEVDAFVRTVLRSGLLTREQLQDTLRTVPLELRDDARRVADHLIRRGRLTPFQAQKLLQGISIGLVIGPFQLEAILGRGGMGSVYLARDTRYENHVALKVLPPKRARAEERQLARFLREKDLAQKVSHPHLALTLEAGEANGIHFIAMEYIPGDTLYRLVTRDGPLDVQRAARLFTEVAQALAAAHDRGLIHRDIKPSNIMVTPHDHAKVLDLGLAYMKGEPVEDIEVVGGKGYVVGSIDYMAPEQTRDATSIDARADIYAVGCCLYFALTGKPPFPEGGLKTKVQAQRQQEPESIRTRNPAVPEGFAEIVHRTLAKNPNARHPNAIVLAHDLQRWSLPTAQPVEITGDAVYQEALRHVMAAVPVAELVDDTNDALIFQVAPDSETAPVESLFREPDPMPRYLMWLALGLGLFWLFASAVVLLALLIRLLAR